MTTLKWRSCLIYIRLENLLNLPPIPDISPLRVVELDINNPENVRQWSQLMHMSFKREIGERQFREYITEHKTYDVTHTYMVKDGDRLVGVISEAVYRRNPDVGVAHYSAVDPAYRGKGLGKFQLLYVLHQLKKHGLNTVEDETTIKYKKALFIHFEYGFRPKFRRSPWSEPYHCYWPGRVLSYLYLKRIYKDYLVRDADRVLNP